MPALPQTNITGNTPMGATLVPGGATFKVWGPSATAVYLNGQFGGVSDWSESASQNLLIKDLSGYWTGYLAGVSDGDLYKYFVVGASGSQFKRDPYARELTPSATFPFGVNCIVRAADSYPWHDQAYVAPDFSDLVIYQLHIGTYAPANFPAYGTFLDIISKIPYLAALGINMIQPLPFTENEVNPSMGYAGADYFSPDTYFVIYDSTQLGSYLDIANGLLAAKGLAPLVLSQISGGVNQFKAMVDLCHVYGIAVALDVVYGHGGGFEGDNECIYFWDLEANTADINNSLYCIDQSTAGGLAFALWKQEVSQFLIDNSTFLLKEGHADGLRYDEVSELLALNQTNGWGFCGNLTDTIRFVNDRAIQNAEYWPWEYSASIGAVLTRAAQGGAGFDVVQHDALRTAIRNAVGSASYGMQSPVSMTAIASSLYPPGLSCAWNAVTCIENHDLVFVGRDPRIPVLADSSNPESFYARSRSKFASGLLLAAPGIPQIFMGQEFLQPGQWDCNPAGSNLLLWGQLDGGDKSMSDQLRFTQDFIRLRQSEPAMRGQNINVFHVHDSNRVVAFHRWLDGQGKDVVVVASLNDSPFFNYQLGFPQFGLWAELFNSDVYDNWVNPLAVGNNGAVYATGGPLHNLPFSASITIPPRAILVFGVGQS